jgi:hypothetical protein
MDKTLLQSAQAITAKKREELFRLYEQHQETFEALKKLDERSLVVLLYGLMDRHVTDIAVRKLLQKTKK